MQECLVGDAVARQVLHRRYECRTCPAWCAGRRVDHRTGCVGGNVPNLVLCPLERGPYGSPPLRLRDEGKPGCQRPYLVSTT